MSEAISDDAGAKPLAWRRWLFALVPLVALIELLAQWRIQSNVPRPEHWRAAHDHIARARREGDLVTSAPWWTDPLARMYFRDLIPLRDAARPDATRYARAWVATIRDGEHPDLRGWREESRAEFGKVTVRLMVNPRPARVLYDFADHLHPPDARVARVLHGEATDCGFHPGNFVAGGGLGQGALAPPDRFQCSSEGWNYVGVTVIEDMEHRGRRCMWSHPIPGGVMATRFENVPIGTKLHGHHGIAYEAERGDDFGNVGGPVNLTVRIDDQEVGTSVHHDGEGWKGFEFDTRAWAGTTHAVTFEVSAPQPGMRHYCFEGDTR